MTEISRRSVAKGTAWAVPAVAVAASAPAMAASPVPGLQGRVYWTEYCSGMTVGISPDDQNGADLYPNGDYGFYVFNTKASQVSAACMTFTYPASLGSLTWKANSNNGQWSVPKVISKNSSTITYQSCYSGAFADHTYNDPQNNSQYYASVTSYPSFSASIPSCANPLNITITRTVSVNGSPITFSRSISVNPV